MVGDPLSTNTIAVTHAFVRLVYQGMSGGALTIKGQLAGIVSSYAEVRGDGCIL